MLTEGMYIGQTEKEQPATAAFIRELLAARGAGRVGASQRGAAMTRAGGLIVAWLATLS